jgi:histidinol-phosphate aminotransferase
VKRPDPVRAAIPPDPVPEVARLRPYTVPAAGRRPFLRLDFNENTTGPSPRVLARLRSLTAEDVGCYPDETEARAAVARHFGLGGRLDLVLTAGVDEGIRLVCDCFVRAGEAVIVLDPGYAMYRFYATLAGADIREVAIEPDLSFPEAAARRAVAAGCRLLILGNPHNPTGAPVPEGLLADLADRHPETLLLVDEAYVEFGGASALCLLPGRPNLIVARTFSKAYGLAGLRAGALLGERDALSFIARMRSPYAVNGAALAALPVALDDADHVRRHVADVRAARALLDEGLRRLGLTTFPSAANFLLARFGDRAPAVREALRERGILVRDRSDGDILRGTLRIGVGTLAQTARFLKVLESILAADGHRRPGEDRP